MKIKDIIDQFIAGDWGEETCSNEMPCAVTCVRGADIVPIFEYDFSAIPIRYISQQSYSKKCLQVGDIIIEKSGGSPTQSTGRVSFVSQELLDSVGAVVCSNFCTAFRVKKDWNPLYVYYHLQFVYNLGVFFNFEGKTSGLKNLQLEAAFAAIPIEDISKNAQDNIVSILQGLDRKIAINRQINQNLEAMAKQLYDYWFVQFDFPDEEGKPYKASGGEMVWNEKLKREIPQGWDVKTIGNCTTILLGGTPDTNDSSLWGDGYNWLNSGEVAEFPILSSEKYITQKGLEKSSTVLVPKGSVTLSITRHLRPSILCIDACINQSVVAILENEILTNEYIYPLVNREIPRLMSLRTGAQQPHINKEIVESINIVIPPQEILYAYIKKSKSLYKSIFINAQEIADLAKQRDELLPLLMNGQVSVNSDLAVIYVLISTYRKVKRVYTSMAITSTFIQKSEIQIPLLRLSMFATLRSCSSMF